MILLLRLPLSFCFDWKDKSNTRDTVSSAIQITTMRVVFSTLHPDETLSLVFDIWHEKPTRSVLRRAKQNWPEATLVSVFSNYGTFPLLPLLKVYDKNMLTCGKAKGEKIFLHYKGSLYFV